MSDEKSWGQRLNQQKPESNQVKTNKGGPSFKSQTIQETVQPKIKSQIISHSLDD